MSLEISPILPKSSQEPRELCNMSLDKMRISSESSSISNGKGFTRSDTSSQNWAKFEPVYFKDLLPVQEDLNSKKRISTTKKSEDKDISAEIVDAHDKTSDFLRCLVELLLDYMKRSNDRSTKVLDFHHPHTMKEILGHCLEVQHEPQTIEQILSDCKETLKYCVKTAHPRFFNQISTGMDSVCLAGEWLTAAVNTNMFTYEIAPVFTLMENVILRKMRSIVGWDNGDGDGLFAPGGAISNLYAAIVARHKFIPEAKTQGLYGMPRLVMFTSEQCHFSIQTAGSVLGIGTDNVILVKSDSRGRMIPRCLDEEIEKAKAAGSVPFFVSATEGTTVLGAFDPLNEIADICERHGIWFHVDAAWGGGLLLTDKYKRIFAGVERADSVTWNPHKLMGAHLQCSVILFKQKGLLEGCNCTQASYLFQQDKQYDIQYDTGDKAIQCGRHNDIFKLWLMWRSKGDTGFEKQINRLMDLSKYLQKKLSGREGYEFVLENPEFLNVCFWYIPKCMRHMSPGLARDEMLDKVAPRIKAKMMEKGSTMVGYQPLGSKPNFFRMIISNPATNLEDIDFLVEEIETLGEEIVI